MGVFKVLIATALLVLLAACEDEVLETYPLSGETCSADDPVLDLDPIDCIP